MPEAPLVAPAPTPHAMALRTLLAWLDERPRRYGETMEAWRSACPRRSVWEDALAGGLVRIAPAAGGGMAAAPVALTERGQLVLGRAEQAQQR
jgi:hypothetical protein